MVVKRNSTCKSVSQKGGPLIEGMEESPVWLEHQEGEAKTGSLCDQVPGKGQTYKSISKGHAEDFELYPKNNEN